ncbi:MAG: aminotransferase class I/II-fold pyridoxal phosphate-dependent enzyme [Acholeplasmataceae bacterium]|nr:aminotransferase class I/II-fold pyridoxal phosphate-dependent enzyme [Acholeplasmataceae bacterium]
MSYLSKHRQSNILTGDTFQIAREAKAAKDVYDDVIDATVGALYEDDGTFYAYKTITQIINKLPADPHFRYAPTSGGLDFKENINRWVFGPYQSMVENNFQHSVVASPGASGALYNTFLNYLDDHTPLIMPDIYWTNYLVILKSVNRSSMTYPMFDGDFFNIEGFITTCEKVLEHSDKLVCLFNDPAHNPTGYTLSIGEWERIYAYLNGVAEAGKKVVLIYDLAYIDYDGESLEDSRRLFDVLKKVYTDILIIIAYSGSKSFSLYGLRVGAAIALSKRTENIEDFNQGAIFTARATWSCPPSTGIQLVNRLFSNDMLMDKFKKELKVARTALKARATLFLSEAATEGLKTYPYHGGFFITIPTDNPEVAFDKLKDIHIYTIPVPKGVRLAISSIPLTLITGMAKRIKDVL